MFVPPYGGLEFPYKDNLNWIIAKIKELMQSCTSLQEAWEKFQEEFQGQLSDTVMNILQGWLEDGTLETIISGILSDYNYRIVNVQTYGAKGDGNTDDSEAFKNAIQAMSGIGGIVYVPPTENGYLINSQVIISENVTLMGSGFAGNYTASPTTQSWKDFSTIIITNQTVVPFKLGNSSAINGLRFYYPNQIKTDTPIEYPEAIQFTGWSGVIKNIFFVNAYRGIASVGGSGGTIIENISGTILNCGISVMDSYDVTRIKNVHFWAFWYQDDPNYPNIPIAGYVQSNATGILLGHNDEIHVDDIFIFEMGNALYLTTYENRGPYGIYNNIALDKCNRSIVCASLPTAITGNIFNNVTVALSSESSTQAVAIYIYECNKAKLTFNNVTIWHGVGYNRYIYCSGGNILLTNLFLQDTSELIEMITITNNATVGISNAFFGSIPSGGYHINSSYNPEGSSNTNLINAYFTGAKRLNSGNNTITEIAVVENN